MRSFRSEQFSSKDPNLHVFFCKIKGEDPIHTHDFIEIMYVNSGEIEQFVNDKRFVTKKGDLIFMNYNSVHKFKSVGEATYYNVCFYPETMERMINPNNAFSLLLLSTFNEFSKGENDGIVSFAPAEQRKVQYLFERMVEEQTRRLPNFALVNESYMAILITLIARKASLPEESENDTWSELVEYINDNLDSGLTLEALAKKCFYNPSYFSRLFKNKFNVSLVEYISNKRVEKALQLLTETDMSIKEISTACGFSNRSVFYRAFSKITGKTPTEYRKNNNIVLPLRKDKTKRN